LFGRCARQGDPGSTEAIVSIDDELFLRFAPVLVRRALALLVKTPLSSRKTLRWLVKSLQDRAERHYRKQRQDTVQRDAQTAQSLGFVGRRSK